MKNLVGKVVGRLTVIRQSEKVGYRCAWLCKCSCGKEVVVLQQSLIKYSPTSSCGCLRDEANIKNLFGLRYGLWAVKSPSTKKKKPNGGMYWLCLCDCGTEKDVSAETLLCGKSTNCGCSKNRPICLNGHIISEWGRDKTGQCRACLKNRNLLREYGITLAEYISLWEYQGGKCAVCGIPISIQLGRPGFSNGCRAELDHEHNNALAKKDQVRGILCGGRWSGCNRKLGHLDKPVWLAGALKYITDPPARRLFKTTPFNEK